MAQRVVHHVAQVLMPDCVPLLLTDGFREYVTPCSRTRGTGCSLNVARLLVRRLSHAECPYPSYSTRRWSSPCVDGAWCGCSTGWSSGTLEAVKQALSTCGWQSNTAFIERVNLTIRQHGAAVGRRVTTLCKGEDGLRQQRALSHTYDNLCVPHASLCQALLHPVPTNGTGSARQWRPCTPAMAAGLPDPVWSLRDVLPCRVPPWPQPQSV